MGRFGLFIGVNDYEKGIKPLSCAREDAMTLYRMFSDRGFDAIFMHDADVTAVSIFDKLEMFRLKSGDIFVFYFSGHGCEDQNEHYLLSSDARSNLLNAHVGMIPLAGIKAATDIPGVQRLFVLDCCKESLLDGRGVAFCPESRDLSLQSLLNAPANHQEIIPPLIATSCSTGEKAFENKKTGHGFYTEIIINALKDPTTDSFENLRSRISSGMQRLHTDRILPQRQTPSWLGDVDGWNHIPLFPNWKPAQAVVVDEQKISPSEIKDFSECPDKKQPTPANYPSPEEQEITPEEVKEYTRHVDRIKKFSQMSLIEKDRLYIKKETDSAQEKVGQGEFKRAFSQISALAQWCDSIERKYSLKQLEETISARVEKLRSVLPDTFDSAFTLAHSYLRFGFLDEAEAEYSSLNAILQAEEVRADSWGRAIEKRFVFSEDKTVLKKCIYKDIETVDIPNGVTTIGMDAFRGCANLTSVKIPDGVTTIGMDAFYGCAKLTSVKIPDGVTTIEIGAFYGCQNLTSVNIPSSVSSIGKRAFRKCPCREKLKQRHPKLF